MGDIKFIEDDDIYKDDEFGFIGEGTIVEPDVPYEVSIVYQYENDILNNKDFQESKKFEEKNNLQYFYDKWKGIDIVLICSFSNYSFLKEINSDNVVTDNQLFIYMIRHDKEYNDVFYSNKLVYKFGEYTKQTIARNWQEFEEFVENDFLKGDIYYAPEIINSIELELEE
jgi:hypothetical protein